MRRDAPVKTFEEYVVFEVTANMWHEFIDGNLFVIAGGSQEHNMIAGALAALLRPAVKARGCRIFASDMIVRVLSGRGFYPDVLVTCDLDMNQRYTDSVKSLHLFLRTNCVQQRRKPVRCWCQRQERNPYLFLRPSGQKILKELTGIGIM